MEVGTKTNGFDRALILEQSGHWAHDPCQKFIEHQELLISDTGKEQDDCDMDCPGVVHSSGVYQNVQAPELEVST